MQYPPLAYQIALTLIPGIGSVNAKKLIAYTGGVEAIFREKRNNLLKIPGIGEVIANEVLKQDVFPKVEKELEFIEKYKVRTLFFLDDGYPERLKQCDDCPVLLYSKGETDFNAQRMLAIVGTRNATNYGKEITEKIVSELASRHNLTIVSGLAFGIDIAAHKAALKAHQQTIAVVAHGLQTVYPPEHTNYAKNIIAQGAMVTEFTSSDGAERPYFVRRNRIVAGMSDATLVVESGAKGGALITAELASSYDRDVFAIPGKATDSSSRGCNKLIKTNKAALVESAEDIEYLLGWDSQANKQPIQRQLFVEVSDEEQKLLNILKAENDLSLDIISSRSEMPISKVSPILLNLEFSGIVRSLPGKIYKLL